MALKDIWIDKVDGVDDVSAKDPNIIAHAVIDCENNIAELKNNEILNKQSGEILYISDSKNAPIEGLIIYGKTTQAAEPTPEAPQELKSVGADGDIKVNILGKNLQDYRDASKWVLSGGTYDYHFMLPKGKYTFSYKAHSAIDYVAFTTVKNGEKKYNYLSQPSNKKLEGNCTFDIDSQTTDVYFGVSNSGMYLENLIEAFDYIQVEAGTVATDYEPYQEPQVMTIPTHIALNGIPVLSNGNFTDESGQQWVTDEIDFERGVRIQRIGSHTVTDANQLSLWTCEKYEDSGAYYFNHYISKLNGNYTAMCNLYKHSVYTKYGEPNYVFNGAGVNDVIYFSGSVADLGEYTDIRTAVRNYLSKFISAENPMIVHYVLQEPIETPLTEAELVAYQEYYTNYPNTTIYSEDGAFLNIKYKADTKHYIDNKFNSLDNKFNSLEKAIISLGGNV